MRELNVAEVEEVSGGLFCIFILKVVAINIIKLICPPPVIIEPPVIIDPPIGEVPPR